MADWQTYIKRRGDGVVERARLEIECAPKVYRGFESPPLRVLNFTRTRVKFFFAHSPLIRSTNGFAAHNPFNTVRVFILYFKALRAQNRGFFRPKSFHSVKFLSTTYDAKLWGILTANAIRAT